MFKVLCARKAKQGGWQKGQGIYLCKVGEDFEDFVANIS